MRIKSWVNGVEADQVSLSDRGLAYGDGLFETMRALHYQIPLLDAHLNRLRSGAQRLGISYSDTLIQSSLRSALDWLEQQSLSQAVVKLILTRGGDALGYRSSTDAEANILVSVSDLNPALEANALKAKVCCYTVPENPQIAGIKHLNRLDQVLASLELGAEYQEGLLVDHHGYLVEAISSNLFVVFGGEMHTPTLSNSGVKGVMRDFVASCVSDMDTVVLVERNIRPDELMRADEILLTNSVRGIRNLTELCLSGLAPEPWRKNKQTPVGDLLRAQLCQKLGSEFLSF